VIQAKGTRSYFHGEERLKLASIDAITVLESGVDVPNKLVTLEDLDASYVGFLVKTRGLVIQREADRFTIEDGEQELEVRLKEGTGISSASVELGTNVTVTGVLTSYDDHLRLLPKSAGDIIQETAEDAGVASSGETALVVSSSRTPDLVFGSLLAGGTTFFVLWRLWRHRRREKALQSAGGLTATA
jgi:hypothetical protein